LCAAAIERATKNAFLLDISLSFLFGLGLQVGGMVEQQVVMGAFGHGGVFVPQLFILFGSALATTFALYRVTDSMSAPLAAPAFCRPTNTIIDTRLICGAITFGAGWALSGLCPGPWVVNLPSGRLPIYAYGVGLVCGILGTQYIWLSPKSKGA